jgi:wobble nucleotide-excising tRNase
MINRIIEIKNLGIFSEYQWNPSLPNFSKYNLIYGWNGSGKTTLSELLNILPHGSSSEYPDLKYRIETSDGQFSQGNPYNKSIRVFNQYYINKNIDVMSCKANPIFILGEENKILADTIKQDEKILNGDPEKPENNGLIKEIRNKKTEKAQKESALGDKFTNVAKLISSSLKGVAARNYRKNNALEDFQKLAGKKSLSQEEINKLELILVQQELAEIPQVEDYSISDVWNSLFNQAHDICKTTVEVVVIERLRDNIQISSWVEQGLKIHVDEGSSRCEFCNQVLPEDRISLLSKYFTQADQELKNQIDTWKISCEELLKKIQNIKVPDKANFYSDLQLDYIEKIATFDSDKELLLESIKSFITVLDNKKQNTTIQIDVENTINPSHFIISISNINKIISEHNKKTKLFIITKKETEKIMRDHYLSDIWDDVQKLQKEINQLSQNINELEDGTPGDESKPGIKAIQDRIAQNKGKISESGKACDQINENLETFLGRNELEFEVSTDGYSIKRNGKVATHLSEGEKTAIAFVYFIIHLSDRDFDKENGIIVIDDPISSLDSNSLFQAFSFLKTSVTECAQVFILTHNFDFLQLIINWLEHSNKRFSNYYMINNKMIFNNRCAIISKLDNLLRNYSSEYQYLFKLLYKFESDGSLESVYHIPNIARKVLDNFLMVYFPDNSTPYKKLEKIEFNEKKKTAIYKFTNDQSHITGKGFDPSLVAESQNVIKYLLEMMKDVFPNHYNVLVQAVDSSDND